MRSYEELFEMIGREKLKSYGLTEEYFYSLPYECQRAIMMAGIERKRNTDLRKKIALKQYNFEENVKKKVLSILKKK